MSTFKFPVQVVSSCTGIDQSDCVFYCSYIKYFHSVRNQVKDYRTTLPWRKAGNSCAKLRCEQYIKFTLGCIELVRHANNFADKTFKNDSIPELSVTSDEQVCLICAEEIIATCSPLKCMKSENLCLFIHV